ncbi:MAG: proteasome regulatory particle base subunit [Trizodia sp. TS-e1964]|nr:MAG: proteasome regulatory particle base subunit [Trizodia sp. TS-e1964]
MVGLTSAAGLLGFLSEPDLSLRVFALKRLDANVDLLWTEIAASIGQIEALSEDTEFPERELASLLAAKVYYHLQEYNESMQFALGAGKLFDLEQGGEFEETIISKCVDTYIALSALQRHTTPANASNQPPSQLTTAFPHNSEGVASTSASLASPITPFSQSTLPSKSLLSRQDTPSTWDPSLPKNGTAVAASSQGFPLVLDITVKKNLQAIVERLFEKCFREGRYRQVIGIAIEAKNLSVLRRAIQRASDDEKKESRGRSDNTHTRAEELVEYVLEICMGVVQERGLRSDILSLVLDLLNEIPTPDYFAIAKCVVYLDQHSLASKMLRQLVNKPDSRSLATAYQICFDLYDNGSQEFLSKVADDLPKPPAVDRHHPQTDASGAATRESDEDAKETDSLLPTHSSSGDPAASATIPREKITDKQQKVYFLIRSILRGAQSVAVHREFLVRNNRTDISILNKVRDSVEARNSIFHSAVTFCNAFMNVGTTNDQFIRQNLEWLGKAVNWSKFSATAALGVIHKGNVGQGQKLLEPYLPRDAVAAGSVYSQGGSLYALGLIYANQGTDSAPLVISYLKEKFVKSTEEVIQHGGALGLGVCGMASGSDEIYEGLRKVLETDSAISGEAVGLSMGLVMLGTGNIKVLEDMIQYAHDTQHEKIVRGLAIGMALIMYSRQEAADELINGMLDDPDPVLRYGGILTLAMAYCGTGSNKAVRKLLHVAVSDVSDDVRRIAVMSLGFILFRKPSSVPRMVELLSESYNPHVRYGAAMALGISCAGTGLDEAIDLLEPMLKDPTDFVRQGALIALALILIQQNEAMNPKVTSVRKTFQRTISDRHEDAMAKFGCALALGIIDAGGRNCTIGLQTQTGNLNMAGIVGMAVFTQYWYWFPFTHFLSLSFTPTSIIGLDHDLDIPAFKYHSATRPSLFDYPPEQEAKTDEAPEKVATAVLSTTAQAKRRAQKKERLQRPGSMDVDPTPTTPKMTGASLGDTEEDIQVAREAGKDEKPDEKEDNLAAESSKKKAEKEKVGYDMDNMSRVLPAQLKFISFPEGRYTPVKKPTGGVILLVDSQPNEAKTLLELKSKAPEKAAATESPQDGIDAAYRERQQNTERSGAADAVGVLTAIDEDVEGGEEAQLPKDFEYFSDGAIDED